MHTKIIILEFALIILNIYLLHIMSKPTILLFIFDCRNKCDLDFVMPFSCSYIDMYIACLHRNHNAVFCFSPTLSPEIFCKASRSEKKSIQFLVIKIHGLFSPPSPFGVALGGAASGWGWVVQSGAQLRQSVTDQSTTEATRSGCTCHCRWKRKAPENGKWGWGKRWEMVAQRQTATDLCQEISLFFFNVVFPYFFCSRITDY